MIPLDLLIGLIITAVGGLYIISPINLLPFNPIDEVGVGIVLIIMWAVIGITRFQMLISTLAFPDVTIWVVSTILGMVILGGLYAYYQKVIRK